MKTLSRTGEIPSTPSRFIWFSVRPYWKWLGGIVLFVFLAQLFGDATSYVFRGLIDSANAVGAGTGSTRTVLRWVVAYPALIFLSAVSYRVVGLGMNYLTARTRTGVMRVLFEYLSLHSSSYFSDRFSGALSNRVGTVAMNVSRLLNQFVGSILRLLFSAIVSFGFMFSASRLLALVFAGGFLVLIPLNIAITKRQLRLSETVAKLVSKLRGQVVDVVSNIMAVQQYARREHEIARLDETIEEYRRADIESDNYREKVLFFNNLLVSVFVGGIIVWAFMFWSRGGMSVGTLIMIVTLASRFVFSLTFIGQNVNDIMEAYGEIQDGLGELIVPHDIIDAAGAKALVVKRGEIRFEEVAFAYEPDTDAVLNDLSLVIKAGEKVGVVGASGAGKTTLAKLLLRQHDLTAGRITIDGQDIRAVTQESLRGNISVVPQEPLLFHRTVRENICYGKLDATGEEMLAVAKKAHAHEFIEKLPDGYDSLVGERGVKLSVGQRQRVIIARAFLKNAPILILDEATSALDSESEVAVQHALHNLMEDKTAVVIAHRLSTLREMDRILVFQDGRIVEDGTHASLAKKKNGVYASLWSHQAGGFLE